MGKLLIVMALTALTPFFWQPLLGQSPRVGVNPSGRQEDQTGLAAKEAQSDQRGTKNAPLVVDTEGHQYSPAETAERKRKNNEKELIERRSQNLTIANTIFTGILMIVGIGGVTAALLTLNAIKNQGSSMKAQNKMMLAQFDQWVYLNNWRVDNPWSDRIRVQVDLINPTSFPMTISSGYMTFDDNQAKTTHCIGNNTFLPPNIPNIICITIGITPDQAHRFANGSLNFLVSGQFTHYPRIGENAIVQPFRGFFYCGMGTSEFDWEVHMNPETEQEQRDRDSRDQLFEESGFKPN